MSAARYPRRVKVGEQHGQFSVVRSDYIPRRERNRGVKESQYTYWVCLTCKEEVCSASGLFDPSPHLSLHHERGHSACEFCGKVLTNCNDGSPRQHPFNKCPGKDESYRVLTAFESDIVENFRKLPSHLKEVIKKELAAA